MPTIVREVDVNSEENGLGLRFTIRVAAEAVNVHQQTLRHYERLGLIAPHRGTGRIRYFTPKDIERLRLIRRLMEELKVNLAGVEVILNLTERIELLQREMEDRQERMREGYEAELRQTQSNHEAEIARLKDIIRRVTAQV
ncbi:MAG TPA: MerR family transcriptional regulator [Chloroflexota bacterium]|nr:MerR family transcriptional regulator [Chloroflexota bacterium]